ncbi:triple tyrosine motif-containing protein [uncultured Maribacter sp.]|uniref:triple tyrosine motif-containing protein n=1 Tax=uncultured Maribacter sp. TaxID=431308 RepID=UPI0030D85626|tara:strand:+ start:1397 stop:4201 length:2805 start_codon:yes stop_codon:yes gene_type:complete
MILRPFYIVCIFFILGINAQELSPIQNYTPIEYAAGNQNWSITQSIDKHIYIANNGGLLEFNGAVWKLYQSPNGTPLKSVKIINDRVFTGSYMEFGYWIKDDFGVLIYNSISSKIEQPLIEDEHFWNISKFKDWVLFQSLDRIYIYNTINGSIDILDAKTTRASILEVGNKIYFQKINEGIFTIDNGKSVLVSDNDIFKTDIIIGAFLKENKILFVTEQSKFYFLDKAMLTKWDISADVVLSKRETYSALRLNDGSFVLGTISNGVYHLDNDGTILNHINQEKGLNNNTVLSLFQDVDQNLWLGLDNGLSVINLDSPFNEYIDHNGVLGVVYTAVLYDDILYLGTNQGLFYKRRNEDVDFQLVDATQGQVWLLKVINGTLFCGHHKGTYVIENGQANQISDVPGTWDIHKIESNVNLLLQGNYKGLSILEKINGQWSFRNKIEGFNSSSRFFEFLDIEHIVVNHDYKGIFDLKVDTGFNEIIEVTQKESKGPGSSLLKYDDEVIYTTINGVFKYITEQQDFGKDSILTSKFFNANESIIGILKPTNNSEKIWGFTNDNIICVSPGILSDVPQRLKISIPDFFRRSMGILGFESIVHLKDEVYLIGIANGYVTVDLNKVKQNEYQISINSIFKEFYDAPNINIKLEGFNEFKSSENNLKFLFNVPEFDKYTDAEYQYRLEEVYNEWSTWSSNSEVSFTNLPYGNHTFEVRAKVGNNLSKNTASYEFMISKPWYLTYGAIFCYLVLITLLVVFIHKLYKGYYKKQQNQLLNESKKRLKRKKLKNQKRIVQIKNAQLKELIESKNRELAISTMSIIKKNEFLNSIKEQLNESSVDSQVKSVIRTIDRNINNVDDWKFFENAFNNADKDFLKKVKNVHPELSANDLRLCAYLRLNLSSKEIAPLLNISVRSVEVKRYRLRKKMNLLREDGLTEYIMDL